MSLLIHSQKEEYNGWSFLVESEQISTDAPTKRVWQDFTMLRIAAHSFPCDDELNWLFFPNAVQNIKNVSRSLENADDLVTDLYTYIRAVLEEYLKDIVFVEFLKSG